MLLRFILSTALAVMMPHLVAAETPVPVVLEPITHTPATLTVVSPDGIEHSYSPADLETLPTYRLTTRTPWRTEPAVFDGILLSDLLDANGMGSVAAIKVTAENDYVAVLPRALWDSLTIVIATRVDGQAHSRRNRGPIQFVIDQDSYQSSDITNESHLVWMAARIEPH